MQPDRVVPAFNKAETGHFRLGLRREPAALQQFAFQRGEEVRWSGFFGQSGDPVKLKTPLPRYAANTSACCSGALLPAGGQ